MRQIMFQPRRTDNLSAGLFGRSLGGSGGSFLDEIVPKWIMDAKKNGKLIEI